MKNIESKTPCPKCGKTNGLVYIVADDYCKTVCRCANMYISDIDGKPILSEKDSANEKEDKGSST